MAKAKRSARTGFLRVAEPGPKVVGLPPAMPPVGHLLWNAAAGRWVLPHVARPDCGEPDQAIDLAGGR